MMYEWKIDKDKLRKFIFKEYAIEVKKLDFVPKGEDSYGYLMENKDGERFFVKMYYLIKNNNKQKKELEVSLGISLELFSKCGIDNISYPILTKKNKLKSNFNKIPVALFNYIEGKNDEELKLSKKELENIANLLALIHKKTKRLDLSKVKKEQFNQAYSEQFRRCLKTLKNKKLKNDEQKKLAEIVLPKEKKLLEIHKELRKISKLLNRNNKKFVICHTDPHVLNLIVGKNGLISLIDWDRPVLAPKEHDLWFYLDRRYVSFLNAYKKEFGKFKINKQIVHYYYVERHFDDFTHLLSRLLFMNNSKKENLIDLEQVKDYTDRWIYDREKEINKLDVMIHGWNNSK